MKTIRRRFSTYRKCLALKPAPQCYASTPEEEAPPRDESPPTLTSEVRSRFDGRRTPVERRRTGRWSSSSEIHAAARYRAAQRAPRTVRDRIDVENLGQPPKWQRTTQRTTDLVRHLAPDGDPSSAPEAPAPDTRVVLTPRSSDSPRVSEAPEKVPPESTVTYPRDEGEGRAQSDDEGSLASQVSVDETEDADRSLAPSPERENSEGSSSPLGMEDQDSESYMSSDSYRHFLIDTKAKIWGKFSNLNPGWQQRVPPDSDPGPPDSDPESEASSVDEPPEQ